MRKRGKLQRGGESTRTRLRNPLPPRRVFKGLDVAKRYCRTDSIGRYCCTIPDMDISILSLIVAALAVFFGPVISWKIAKHQICASTELARDQMRSSLKTADKQITAPMRQAWINKLRELLAKFTSTSTHYHVEGVDVRPSEQIEALGLLLDHIRLMLNPTEDDHQRLEKLIYEMLIRISGKKANSNEFADLREEVIDLSRTILKREWDRVKEPMQE